jgi:beta-lactam-binding protein with PASTA domain
MSLLQGLGLDVTVDQTPIPSDQPAGTVASTDPSAGSTVDPGASITLQLSSGQNPATPGPTDTPTPHPTPTNGRGGGGPGNG